MYLYQAQKPSDLGDGSCLLGPEGAGLPIAPVRTPQRVEARLRDLRRPRQAGERDGVLTAARARRLGVGCVEREEGDRDRVAGGERVAPLAQRAAAPGDADVAEQRLAAAGEMFRDLGDWGGLNWSFAILGWTRFMQGRLAEAEQIAREQLPESESSGNRWVSGILSVLLGNVTLWAGRPVAAVQHARDAVARFSEIGDAWGETQGRVVLVRSLAAAGAATADGLASGRVSRCSGGNPVWSTAGTAVRSAARPAGAPGLGPAMVTRHGASRRRDPPGTAAADPVADPVADTEPRPPFAGAGGRSGPEPDGLRPADVRPHSDAAAHDAAGRSEPARLVGAHGAADGIPVDRALGPGGRLVVRGPNVMLGYLRADTPGVIRIGCSALISRSASSVRSSTTIVGPEQCIGMITSGSSALSSAIVLRT